MIPRDALRVVALIPFADRYTEGTIARAWWWADEIMVGVEKANLFDAESVLVPERESSESMTILWAEAERRFDLTTDDYVAILHSGEVLADASPLRPALRHSFGQRLGVTLHWMWNKEQYRSDWQEPRTVWPFIPYRREGRFTHPPNFILRGPHYASSITAVQYPVADLLAYRFATPDSRDEWHDHYKQSSYEPHKQYQQSLYAPARLQPWVHGGLM
jgi:hypothetical protein